LEGLYLTSKLPRVQLLTARNLMSVFFHLHISGRTYQDEFQSTRISNTMQTGRKVYGIFQDEDAEIEMLAKHVK
jgi:cytochrome b